MFKCAFLPFSCDKMAQLCARRCDYSIALQQTAGTGCSNVKSEQNVLIWQHHNFNSIVVI